MARKLSEDELTEERRRAEEEEIRQVKLTYSIGLKRSYSRKLDQGLIGSSEDEPPLAAEVEKIIPKNDAGRLSDWKDITGKWIIDAYVLEIVPKSDDPDGEFIHWMEAKHPIFLNLLKRDAKQMNMKISYPQYQVMEYIKKPDGSFNRIEFHKAYHNLLKLADIKDNRVAYDIKWRMYLIFGVPPNLREMPLGYICRPTT